MAAWTVAGNGLDRGALLPGPAVAAGGAAGLAVEAAGFGAAGFCCTGAGTVPAGRLTAILALLRMGTLMVTLGFIITAGAGFCASAAALAMACSLSLRAACSLACISVRGACPPTAASWECWAEASSGSCCAAVASPSGVGDAGAEVCCWPGAEGAAAPLPAALSPPPPASCTRSLSDAPARPLACCGADAATAGCGTALSSAAVDEAAAAAAAPGLLASDAVAAAACWPSAAAAACAS